MIITTSDYISLPELRPPISKAPAMGNRGMGLFSLSPDSTSSPLSLTPTTWPLQDCDPWRLMV